MGGVRFSGIPSPNGRWCLVQSAATAAEMADVDSKAPRDAFHSSRDSLLSVSSSPKKGTEMLSRLVKLQTKVAALRDDRGATAVEYGLMVALIAIVIIVAVTLLGKNLSTLFNNVATSV